MLGLALDEPQESDRRLETEGMTFVLEEDLARRLEPYLPLHIDHDPRYAFPIRVGLTRARCCG